MSEFSNRIETMILEMESGMKGRQPKSYIDDQMTRYENALKEAMKYAPCSGCKRTVLASLVALEIFKEMSRKNRSRAEMNDDEIERIKRDVERRYGF